ncbi:glutathione S-transferase family protein [Motilimonas cestriensis]|uniref:Glutathione S-transferase family protein n=1 Tax=Motilimonas cestriensis TaxID=2742685 RepID=A0ABS8W7M4_9GAMM|nr:glutathione S-transferase family protein [Motilimonas cestriensis]MCE2593516.1 glutathione S-transferase family protein [Motilimonas cestriensis]
MGLLVKGQWRDQWYDTEKSQGEFKREQSQFRHQIEPDSEKGFFAEFGRYHLYVSLACPWAHRALIFRQLKDLTEHISVSVVSPDMLENGWEFDQQAGLVDDLYHNDYLYQIYQKADPLYTGRVTVPILWDKQTQTIVNNESAEIIRIFNSAFNSLTGNEQDYYPLALRPEIEAINQRVYERVNNGVYRCGFATTQEAYEQAFVTLFDELDHLDSLLSKQRYLVGDTLTEADWRLFTTLVRFDAVYVGHFKCNHKRIADYPHLQGYLKELYQMHGIADTVNMAHIKRHYYFSHTMINPTQVVPVGPKLDFDSPHLRDEQV